MGVYEATCEAAQDYIDSPDAVDATYNQHDQALQGMQRGAAQLTDYARHDIIRVRRQALCAATSRFIGDQVIGILDPYIDQAGNIDITPFISDKGPNDARSILHHGVGGLLDGAVETIVTELEDEAHPYHHLYIKLCTEQELFNRNKPRQGRKRIGAPTYPPTDARVLLRDAFSDNYKTLDTTTLVYNAIAAQQGRSSLPEADELGQRILEDRLAWQALAKRNRAGFGKIVYGERYLKILEDSMERADKHPDWFTFWGPAFLTNSQSANGPYYGCTADSRLLREPANAVIDPNWKNPHRCAGQIPTLAKEPTKNDKAGGFFERALSAGDLKAYAPTDLTLAIARLVAIQTIYRDETCRADLVAAKRLYDEAAEKGQIVMGIPNAKLGLH